MQENQGLNLEKQPLVEKLKAANQFHPKRKHNSIIGTSDANKINIKGVRQFGHLHVCKLDTNIGEAEVNEYLNENGFDDVRCAKLDSRRPEYSSFRISVLKDKIDSLKNPEIWPEEHWANASSIGLYSLRCYEIVSYFYRKNHIHGRVSCYIKPGIVFKPLLLGKYCLELHAEFCGTYRVLKLETFSLTLLVITIYRPSGGNFEVFLDALTDILTKFMVGIIHAEISDHSAQFIRVDLENCRKEEFKFVRRFNASSMNRLRHFLSALNWDVFFDKDCKIDECTSFLVDNYYVDG
ncbi:hypothetical protein WA026_013977 [Henosepilachna vigintioctopunctata]|uniref:Uncharacterized protein n=1 Tax=Henosepilachna vigintioctopunctata TaxID=420089 RepID=A0AAW1U6G0_9CUCU